MAKKKFFTTDDQVEQLVALYEEGQSSVQLSEKFGCSVPIVLKTLKEAGVEVRSASQAGKTAVRTGQIKTQRVSVDREEFARLFPETSYQDLATYFQVSIDTVVNRAREWGFTRTEGERQVLIRKSMLERYGYDHHNQDPRRAPIIAENYRRGREEYSKTHGYSTRRRHWSPEAREVLRDGDSLREYLEELGERPTISHLAARLGCHRDYLSERLRVHSLQDLVNFRISSYEVEIRHLLESWGVSDLRTDRGVLDGKEIDLYSPKHQIGIEFNGDYTHATYTPRVASTFRSESKSFDYHQKKTQLADEKGVFLYHVFQYEWDDEVFQSRLINQLRNVFGKNERTVGARKCQIVEVSPTEKNKFLELNHVQGKDASTVKLGLEYEGQLVSIMTFVRPRFTKKYQWELSRFCSLFNVNVSGGASRLFRHFVKSYSPESVISYSNAAKTRGTLYETLGFEYQHWSDPNYVWVNPSGRTLSRYQTQMKDEVQTMESRGYWRVFDCGNKVWVWTNPDSVSHPLTLSKVTDPEGVPSDCRNLHGND